MMAISELVALAVAKPLPVAPELAAHWGWTEVQFFRSSDNHVFRCAGPGGSAFLRFAPDWHRTVADTRRIAASARALAAAGARVTTPIPTIQGEDVAVATWEGTTYSGSSWTQVTGHTLDADDLIPQTAEEWGRALGRFHAVQPRLGDDEDGAPELIDDLRAAADDSQVPMSIREHARRLVETLSQLRDDAHVVGMIHGDPELDNLCWLEDSQSSPVWIDLDHYASGWFAADICYALRDLAPAGGPPDPEHPLVAAFLHGYEDHRRVSPAEIGWWPHFAAAHAVLTVVSISHASGEIDPAWPDWAVGLQRRFDQITAQTEAQLAAVSW